MRGPIAYWTVDSGDKLTTKTSDTV